MPDVRAWERAGRRVRAGEHGIFVLDHEPPRSEGDPVLILHGFPTCSFDWRHVLGLIGARRRVVIPDLLGYGLSDKPLDHRYSLFEQADIVEEVLRALGLERVALLTHDMGDSVGGELLARALEGSGIDVTARVVTNGSIYMDLVRLSAGQELLLSLPDATLPAAEAPGPELFKPGLAATFGPGTPPAEDELDAQWELIARGGGNRILPRLIRYVEERREHESRWTGAIERHPSPLAIVWGTQDPIALIAMAERLAASRPDATLVRLDVGHYPMIESPEPFARAVTDALHA